MKIREKLLKIQTELKAPKTRYNKFGDYYSRSCEDILEALKPLLKETNTIIKLNNDLELFGEKLFRKSTASLIDVETGESESVHTYTQEALEKPKMSPEQASGSTASYSDKYCLNKLFCLDDTKDADQTNDHGKGKPERDGKKEVKKEEKAPAKRKFERPKKEEKVEDKKESKQDSSEEAW